MSKHNYSLSHYMLFWNFVNCISRNNHGTWHMTCHICFATQIMSQYISTALITRVVWFRFLTDIYWKLWHHVSVLYGISSRNNCWQLSTTINPTLAPSFFFQRESYWCKIKYRPISFVFQIKPQKFNTYIFSNTKIKNKKCLPPLFWKRRRTVIWTK